MKKSYSPFYFIGQAIKSLWRNGVMSFASVAVLMSCLVVMGGFALLVMNIDINLNQLNLNEIVACADYDATPEQLEATEMQIYNLDNVKDVIRVSKDDALKQLMQNEGDAEIYSDVLGDSNPLSDEFHIVFEDVDKVDTLKYQLDEEVTGIRKVTVNIYLAKQLENIKNGVLMIFLWFLVILTVISVFIIINTIKLSVFARRHEITVMRYVGATGWFITLPFVIEGIILGILAGGIGYLIEWYAYHYVEKMVASGSMSIIVILSYSDMGGIILAGFMGVGIITGIIGSVVSLGKYLKV